MLKVKNMTTKQGADAINQFVITDDERRVDLFQSYQSPIIEIDRANLVITVYKDYDYGVTTRKYRNQFLTEQGFPELATGKSLKEHMELGTYKIFTIKKVF